MEFLIEFVLSIALEGCMEACKSSMVPKYVRYLLLAVIALFFTVVVGLIFFAGFLSLRENIAAGIILLLLGVFMLMAGIVKLKREYFSKANQKK